MGFTRRIDNYDAILDTSVRQGFKTGYSEFNYRYFFNKASKLNKFEISNSAFLAYTFGNKFNEFSLSNSYALEFKNSARIEIGVNYNNEALLFASKFVGDAMALPIPKGKYNYSQFTISGNTDIRKNFSVETNIAIGKYYNADFKKVAFTVNARKQPKLNIALNVEFNQLKFPTPYGSDELLLIAPIVEYNFNTNIFWTTFFQYNTQANNFNINSRLQYRFKPMSDLFIVYTDNYFTNPLLKGKNRALVVKLNYWLNM